MKNLLLIAFFTISCISGFSQVGINTSTPSAELDVLAGTSGQIALFQSVNKNNPVGIAQQKVGGAATMELTTKDGSGNQATRILLRGNANKANVELYTGKSGSEVMTIMVKGSNKHVGIGVSDPKSSLHLNGGVQIADDNDTASFDKVGTLRYRADANNSYVEMCMQTGAATYAWVVIKSNTL